MKSAMVPQFECGGNRYGRIMLGTAQLGMDYGITNTTGTPSDAEAREILVLAMQAGVTHLDTARVYGAAEKRLGELLSNCHAGGLKIVTKLPPLDFLSDSASESEVRAAVDASVHASCQDLRRSSLDVLMFHRAADVSRWGGVAVDRVAELSDDGVVSAIGASVYTPSDAVKCLSNPHLTHLQIPFNLLDSRWLAEDFTLALATRPDVCVHARSIFLQGLLLNGAESWPRWLFRRHAIASRVASLTQELHRKSNADLCIAYVRRFDWVTSVVVGAETASQLGESLLLAAEPVLTEAQANLVQTSFSNIPSRLLNPAEWG